MNIKNFLSDYFPSLTADFTMNVVKDLINKQADKMESDRKKREKFMVTLSKVPEPERSVIKKRHNSSMPYEENRFVTLLMSAIEGHELEEQIDYLRYAARLSDDEFRQELIGLEHDPISQLLKRIGRKTATAAFFTGAAAVPVGIIAAREIRNKKNDLADYIDNLRKPFWKRQ